MPTPPKLELTPGLIEAAPARLRAEYTRSFEASGTGARLASAGLKVSPAEVAVPAEQLGAAAGFRAAADPALVADVYFFGRWDALEEGRRMLDALPAPEGGSCRSTQNGAYLVRVIATGPDSEARVWDVVAAIAGEE